MYQAKLNKQINECLLLWVWNLHAVVIISHHGDHTVWSGAIQRWLITDKSKQVKHFTCFQLTFNLIKTTDV